MNRCRRMNRYLDRPTRPIHPHVVMTGLVVLLANGCAPFGNHGNPFDGPVKPMANAGPITAPATTPIARASVQSAATTAVQPSSNVSTAGHTNRPGATAGIDPARTSATAPVGVPPPKPHVARQIPADGSPLLPPVATPPGGGFALSDPFTPPVSEADLVINGFPARTGRIMLGGAVNSDAGVNAQLTIDERNFDIMRFPRSFADLFSGTAFRGAGQTFRIEAAPGNQFQRYTASFADPNLFGYLPISMSVSGFLFDRRFNDWDENRLGGRLAFGYRVTQDLSLSFGVSGQEVGIDPRLPDDLLPEPLAEVNGDNEIYSGQFSIRHDTRDSPIQPSRGHFFDFTFEEAFGDFDYARFETEYTRYFLLSERADGSGRQTLTLSTRFGFSGEETPVFENFFAGGYATMRGFDFRGAVPIDPATGVELGGRFQWLNTVEYMFPITADDAFRGVAFVDFGTVEDDIELNSDTFRVAPGVGLRVAIPMLGPAPLAFDFAVPVAKADFDNERIFSFYMALSRR